MHDSALPGPVSPGGGPPRQGKPARPLGGTCPRTRQDTKAEPNKAVGAWLAHRSASLASGQRLGCKPALRHRMISRRPADITPLELFDQVGQ